ncbi:MAG: pentapeptide repeat-containing protein [Nakamurella sp.]
MDDSAAQPDSRRSGLEADCAQCFGLCCVALSFKASAQFAFDKNAGEPCRNLLADFGCGIHSTLRSNGLRGCTEYTCYGAGQKVAQVTFAGKDWRRWPGTAASMFQVFGEMSVMHETLWFLAEAVERCPDGSDRDELIATFDRIEQLTLLAADEIRGGVSDADCTTAIELLGKVSALIRSSSRPEPAAARTREVSRIGADMRGADLAYADLAAAVLIGADLTGANLTGADLMNADLRAAKLHGADLSDALFLTQAQVGAALGDASTVLSAPLRIPAHWTD